MAKMSFHEKIVCVTGGSRGLGLEITRELVRRGAYVHVIGREPQPFFHKNVIYHRMDLLKERPNIQAVFDVFISNLGVSPGNRRFDDLEYSEMIEILELNVKLQLWFLKNVKYNKFVFINSVLSQQGLPGYSLYCASKSFIHILNQSLRREGKDTMIIYPYKINTPLFREIRDVCTLDAKYVSSRLLDGIENGTKEDFIPKLFCILSIIMGLMPVFLQDILSKLIEKIFYMNIRG